MEFSLPPIEHHYTFEIIRHGETPYNIDQKCQGLTDNADTQLTEKGKNQAKKAGEFLASQIQNGYQSYTKIVSSDLGRAFETASIIQQILKEKLNLSIPLEPEKGLRAPNWGIYEGTSIKITYPDLDNMIANEYSIKNPNWNPEGGGESRNQVIARVFGTIKERMANSENERILFVTHQEIIRVLMSNSSQTIPNCGWVRFEFNPNSEKQIELKWIKETQ